MSKIHTVFPALDNLEKSDLTKQLSYLSPHFSTVKIGLEQFFLHGQELVQEIQSEYDLQVFLDLKLHDIPNTVAKSIKSLRNLNLSFLTVHASGGEQMLEAAYNAAQEYLPNCNLVAVTVMTSIDEENHKNIFNRESPALSIVQLLKIAQKCKIDHLVCSAADLEFLPSGPKYITPGIRFKDDSKDDQKRVMEPKEAFLAGSSYLVMGRSLIRGDETPKRIELLREAIQS